MDPDENQRAATSTGRERRRPWTELIAVWLAFALIFSFLYLVGRRAIINEVRLHAKGVAIAAAACLDAASLETIRGPADVSSASYRVLQTQLDRMVRLNADIRYIYVMRRSTESFAPPHAFVFVVDQPARDRNGDGSIGPDERSEPPGKPYDAAQLPALVEGWERPSADDRIMPDPPYPDLLSGYAPIRAADGRTVALVGVDVTARTVRGKLSILKLVTLLVWLLVGMLITLVVRLYSQQRDAYEEIKRLNGELAARHELLRRAAAQRQEGAADAPPPATAPRMLLDHLDLRIVQMGLAPAGCYILGHDHAAFFLAVIPGDPAGTTLAASYVRMAMLMLLHVPGAESDGAVYVDALDPVRVLEKTASLLASELPPGRSISMAYGVLDFGRDECALAVAGSAFAMLRWKRSGEVECLDAPVGPALAAVPSGGYRAYTFLLAPGDRLLLAEAGASPPAETANTLAAAVAQFRDLPVPDQAFRLSRFIPGRSANLLLAEFGP